MYFTSYFLTILLAVLPAFCSRNGCTHYRVTYIVPFDLKLNKWPGGFLETYWHAFETNKEKFKEWAGKRGVAQHCGGDCDKPEYVPFGKDQWTWKMVCHAPRMARAPKEGIPAYFEGLVRQPEERACDVNCSPSGGWFSTEDCYHEFGHCSMD
ncbi:Protein transport protein [Venturia nashicola]|uniref:Protein transport protein n=1 Tax=Venturia nashicola TaxID=86259 RepID=A0A4Z1P4F8_9PEZI|nr:Protein transport protein [Venturia nashicola]